MPPLGARDRGGHGRLGRRAPGPEGEGERALADEELLAADEPRAGGARRARERGVAVDEVHRDLARAERDAGQGGGVAGEPDRGPVHDDVRRAGLLGELVPRDRLRDRDAARGERRERPRHLPRGVGAARRDPERRARADERPRGGARRPAGAGEERAGSAPDPRGLEEGEARGRVRVEPLPPLRGAPERVHRADAGGDRVDRDAQRGRRVLVRDGDVEALRTRARGRPATASPSRSGGDRERHVDGVEPRLGEGGVLHLRGAAVADGVADHAVERGAAGDHVRPPGEARPSRRSKNEGKLVATHATSSSTTSSPPAKSWAIAIDIAIRWSSRVRTVTPCSGVGPLDRAAVLEELDRARRRRRASPPSPRAGRTPSPAAPSRPGSRSARAPASPSP